MKTILPRLIQVWNNLPGPIQLLIFQLIFLTCVLLLFIGTFRHEIFP